jgi:hypothetical protein
MQRHDRFYNSQTKASSLVLPVKLTVDLHEWLEHAVQVFRCYPNPRIPDP